MNDIRTTLEWFLDKTFYLVEKRLIWQTYWHRGYSITLGTLCVKCQCQYWQKRPVRWGLSTRFSHFCGKSKSLLPKYCILPTDWLRRMKGLCTLVGEQEWVQVALDTIYNPYAISCNRQVQQFNGLRQFQLYSASSTDDAWCCSKIRTVGVRAQSISIFSRIVDFPQLSQIPMDYRKRDPQLQQDGKDMFQYTLAKSVTQRL